MSEGTPVLKHRFLQPENLPVLCLKLDLPRKEDKLIKVEITNFAGADNPATSD